VLAEILGQYQKDYWTAVDRADDVLLKALEKRRDKPAFLNPALAERTEENLAEPTASALALLLQTAATNEKAGKLCGSRSLIYVKRHKGDAADLAGAMSHAIDADRLNSENMDSIAPLMQKACAALEKTRPGAFSESLKPLANHLNQTEFRHLLSLVVKRDKKGLPAHEVFDTLKKMTPVKQGKWISKEALKDGLR